MNQFGRWVAVKRAKVMLKTVKQVTKFTALTLLAFGGSATTAWASDNSALMPTPRLVDIPAHPNADWLEAVRQAPQQFGIIGWRVKDKNVVNNDLANIYSISFETTYPLSTAEASKITRDYHHQWQAPRVYQELELELWQKDASDGDSPWIKAGLLSWYHVNIIFDCGEEGAGFRLYNDEINARTNKRLKRDVFNKEMKKENDVDLEFWQDVCRS
jgi:hypothetical protein